MSIRHMKKEIPGFHYFCLCSEQFTGTNLFQFLQDRAVLLNMQNVHLLFINIIFPLSVPTYLYFDAATFSIKQLSFIQWGKKVFSQPPIVQVLPLKKMREACNFHHRYTSTMRDKIRKKNTQNHIVGFLKNFFANYGGK